MTAPAAAQAYRALEAMIVTLKLAPGEATTEAALIAAAGLGRTPVREAVQRLAWEGFLEIRPRAGITVALLQPADWPRVIDARRGVEAVLAAGAARFVGPEGARALRAAAAAMQDAAAAADVDAFLRADKATDEAIAQASGNVFAARLAGPLQTHSRRFWYRFQRESGLAEAAAHHLGLVDAVLARDEGKAACEAERLMALLRRYAGMLTQG